MAPLNTIVIEVECESERDAVQLEAALLRSTQLTIEILARGLDGTVRLKHDVVNGTAAQARAMPEKVLRQRHRAAHYAGNHDRPDNAPF